MDERIRSLERQIIQAPNISLGVQLLKARLSVGEIKITDIRGAAALDCSSAIEVLEKIPDMESHPKSFYILLGYLALHHPIIDNFLNGLPPELLSDFRGEFLINCNKIVNAFLTGERKVDLSPRFRTELTIREAASALARDSIPTGMATVRPLFDEEQEMRQVIGALYNLSNGYQSLMNALQKNTWSRIKGCLIDVVRTQTWLIDNHHFPAIQEFEAPNKKEKHDALMQEHVNELLIDISPEAITRLVGPYLAF